MLAGPETVTSLPSAGTCCTLAVANFGTSVAVNAGTQYWVVANTPATGTGSNFVGIWDSLAKPVLPIADNHGAAWTGIDGDGGLAGEVLGTIP